METPLLASTIEFKLVEGFADRLFLARTVLSAQRAEIFTVAVGGRGREERRVYGSIRAMGTSTQYAEGGNPALTCANREGVDRFPRIWKLLN
jgi:hypothetical protein